MAQVVVLGHETGGHSARLTRREMINGYYGDITYYHSNLFITTDYRSENSPGC